MSQRFQSIKTTLQADNISAERLERATKEIQCLVMPAKDLELAKQKITRLVNIAHIDRVGRFTRARADGDVLAAEREQQNFNVLTCYLKERRLNPHSPRGGLKVWLANSFLKWDTNGNRKFDFGARKRNHTFRVIMKLFG